MRPGPASPLALVPGRDASDELSRGVLHEIVQTAGEAILVVDGELKARLVNPSAQRLFACTEEKALGQCVDRFIPHVLHRALYQKVRESAAPHRGAGADRIEVTGVHADGRKYALEMSVARLSQGGRMLYSVLLSDVSARRHDQARLNLLVNFDALTSLPNRALFQQRLQGALARAGRFDKTLAVLFYAPAMNAHSTARLALETGLRHALERGEFVLHYQPKIHLATGQITGLEALVRWNRPGVSLVAPGEFIPMAEETGLIMPIGEWALKAACAQNAAWEREGGTPVRTAVNLSARQFARSSLVSDVARVLEATGRDPALLELEITESVVMDDPERAIRTLHQLKSMGIGLALDDFGTGYSSLGTLKRFPIDAIKIDRAFVKDIPDSADDQIITRTIIAMSRSLRLRSIAEGVETQGRKDFLREHGCEEMQGYYFSRPLPAHDLRGLLDAHCGRKRAPRPSAANGGTTR